MKKRFRKNISFLVLVVLLFSLTGCDGKKEEKAFINEEYKERGMKTIIGQDYQIESGQADKSLGIGYSFTDFQKELEEEGKLEANFIPDLGYIFTYFSEEAKAKIKDFQNSDDKSNVPDLSQDIFDYASIFRSAKDEKARNPLVAMVENGYENKELIAEDDKYDYYFAWNSNYEKASFDEKDKENLAGLVKSREEFRDRTSIFPEAKVEASFKDLDTVSVDGEKFTSEDFKDHDITMVNVWATWCTGCIEHMPDLSKVAEGLPENMNMVSVCADGKEEAELLKEILEENKPSFKTILPDEKMEESIIKYLDAYPTTFFVDKEGNILGEAMPGLLDGEGKDLAEEYTKLMEKILEENSK